MVLITVLKVDVSCDKCKQEVFSIVAKQQGVDNVAAASEKDKIIVIGEADPYKIIKRLKKAGKKVEFISVGPPPPKEENKPKPKPEPEPKPKTKPEPQVVMCPCPCPSRSWMCEPASAMIVGYQDPTPPVCSIM